MCAATMEATTVASGWGSESVSGRPNSSSVQSPISRNHEVPAVSSCPREPRASCHGTDSPWRRRDPGCRTRTKSVSIDGKASSNRAWDLVPARPRSHSAPEASSGMRNPGGSSMDPTRASYAESHQTLTGMAERLDLTGVVASGLPHAPTVRAADRRDAHQCAGSLDDEDTIAASTPAHEPPRLMTGSPAPVHPSPVEPAASSGASELPVALVITSLSAIT